MRRPRPIDLNLIPPESRPVRRANATTILLLSCIAGMLLGIVLFQQRLRTDDEVQRWQARLIRSQSTQATLAGGETQATELQSKIAAQRQKLEVMQGDYQDVAVRRVSWSLIYQTMLNAAPQDVSLTAVQQKNFQLLAQGTGASYASITRFADLLNGSGLFSSVQIQGINEATPGTGQGAAPGGEGGVVGFASPIPGAPSTPAPAPTQTAAPPTMTPQPAQTSTPQPSPSAVLPPVNEFYVADKVGVSYPGTADRASVIRGKIVDENGALIPNQKLVLTGGSPETKVEKTSVDGSFEFVVDKKGTYSLNLVGVKSETATGLNTSFPSFTGYHVYDVVFRRGAPRRPPGSGRAIPVDVPNVVEAKPNAATFTFTIVMQVKPGAGQILSSTGSLLPPATTQVPANPLPSTGLPLSGTPQPGGSPSLPPAAPTGARP